MKKTLKTNEKNEQIENLQRKIQIDLYDETFDIFEINKRKNVDVLYDKTIDFSNYLLRMNLTRFDFANMNWRKFFDFDVFEFWLIDVFWLIANLK